MFGIVIDNKPNENVEHLHMADDGKGQSVNIPNFLIGKQDGDVLKEEVHKNATGWSRSNSKHQMIII